MTKITQFNISFTLSLNIFKSPSLNLIHKAFQQYQECAQVLNNYYFYLNECSMK
jgi:hypothetical protein